VSLTQPIRHPDSRSPRIMTTRAWWLVVLNVLIPGSAQVLAGNRRLGRIGLASTLAVWALAVVAGGLALFARGALIQIVSQEWLLVALQALLAAYAVLWVVLALDTLRLARIVRVAPRARPVIAALSVLLMVGTAGSAGYAAYVVGVGRGALGGIFGDYATEAPVDGRYNIMLLGGDAGSDRAGLRPDSITVVSIDADTGRATMVGLPRDMEKVPFSDDSPLKARYPNGYQRCDVDACMLNSIYTEVEVYKEDLYPDAKDEGSLPGIEAMREAVQGITGLTIQYYALIDMQGFSDMVDALGGIDIDVKRRIGMGSGHDDQFRPVPIPEWIEPGQQELDGYHALWYARSRYQTTDYDRMSRQREVQQAVLEQFDPANVLTKFDAIAEAGQQVVKTDIPRGMLGYFTQLALKTKDQPIDDLEIVPPRFDSQKPDFPAIRQAIQDQFATGSAG
jgi:LCP family protein required for cell wall assembly